MISTAGNWDALDGVTIPLRPAIVIVGYNRPDSLRQVLASVNKAVFPPGEIPLVISLDRSNVTHLLVQIAEEFAWPGGPKIIRAFEQRQGLRDHVLQCGDLSAEYGAVILLEDDLIVAPGFYLFALDALGYYCEDRDVAGISLYSHQICEAGGRAFDPLRVGSDVFFGQFSCTWGQCWSKDQWASFRTWYQGTGGVLSAREDVPAYITSWPETSWGKFFVHYLVDTARYYVLPYAAYSSNTGAAGQHNAVGSISFQVPLNLSLAKPRLVPRCQTVSYDAHFGAVQFARYLGLSGVEVVMDLYGTRRDFSGFDYAVSNRALPFKIEERYGLQYRPMEMNLLSPVPGDFIRLYDLSTNASIEPFPATTSLDWIAYEHRTLRWREALRFGAQGLATALLARVAPKLAETRRARALQRLDGALRSFLQHKNQ